MYPRPRSRQSRQEDTERQMATFIGTEGADVLYGGSGADLFLGGGGNDRLYGEAGDDQMRGGRGTDTYDGGEGDNDRISFIEEDATQGVIADLRTGVIANDGFGNAETMTGVEALGGLTRFADEIYGDDRSNQFFEIDTSDRLEAFGGDDLVLSGSAPALLDGGDGTDTLLIRDFRAADLDGDGISDLELTTAGVNINLVMETFSDGFGVSGVVRGVEIIFASTFADILVGDTLDNRFFAGAGADVVDGGAGHDLLDGGEGSDSYLFSQSADIRGRCSSRLRRSGSSGGVRALVRPRRGWRGRTRVQHSRFGRGGGGRHRHLGRKCGSAPLAWRCHRRVCIRRP